LKILHPEDHRDLSIALMAGRQRQLQATKIPALADENCELRLAVQAQRQRSFIIR